MKRQKPSQTRPFNPSRTKLANMLKKAVFVTFGTCKGMIDSFDVKIAENFSITLDALQINYGTADYPQWSYVSGTKSFPLKNLDASTFEWSVDLKSDAVTASRIVGEGKKAKTLTYIFSS